MNEQFKDKVIIVTGSTQGSGAETARLLASRGAKAITICGRQENKGLEVKNQIEKLGTECLYLKADLKNVDDCKKIVSFRLAITLTSIAWNLNHICILIYNLK